MTEVVIRDLSRMAEFRQAEALQSEVWGKDDVADPADLMMVIQAEGGICAGAFHEDRLIGYIFGFPTREPHIQHSHRLAVASDARGSGLGARLKWYQRDWCRERGIRVVRWTFDPLRVLNANLNIAKLGAIGRTYFPDYYGEMAGINAGVPSDRLLVDWLVTDAASTKDARSVMEPASTISIPADFSEMLAYDAERAMHERLRLREAISRAFAAGEEITGFDPALRRYLLTKRAVTE
ncbi:MAG: GNAT family N-acetyltransferase [Cereibacter sphaeroides]|uniref:GNAT family N-acetyltransferase n=1 Tax=Cereibacter sphaeroides TaxID=1063 RepID=A0A2W5S6H4_CERSP|nr:MAG: GNAT family N-acetyltransferase [Cereibacter sphaeroides]